jgi:hypothetical protein
MVGLDGMIPITHLQYGMAHQLIHKLIDMDHINLVLC